MRLTFLGATGTVTGSKFLVENDGYRVLFDCGLFQGLKELRLRNWNPLPVAPATINALVLTHAHLDHTGYLPLLVRNGFRGPVHATAPTVDLCGILLPDSGRIQEEDARFANRKGFSKHHPAQPLYTEQDAERALTHLRPSKFVEPLDVGGGMTVRFHVAGHILGAAHVELQIAGKGSQRTTVFFSGDVGRPDQPILPPPSRIPACDHLLMESTYGDREHPAEDPKEQLATIVRETAAAGGVLLIPAFAVGRAQALLYLLRELQLEGKVPEDLPIHLDSPMAIEATQIVAMHVEAHDPEMRARRAEDPLGLRRVGLAATVEQSKALNDVRYPAIIISASGMATAGRIVHHLAYRLPDSRNTVLLSGFQAAGTRGRLLQDGAREIKIHGRMVQCRARIERLDSMSAHAGRSELLQWLAAADAPPSHIHLIHGEPTASAALATTLRELGYADVHLPKYGESIEL